MNKYATYIRVSTAKQGRSGLGLESQQKICGDFIAAQGGTKIAEFKDVESGTHRDRRGLIAAIEFCKTNKCGLVIAKLDRLARDVEFCFRVVNTGIDIHFCDMPTINTLLLGVFAAVAQYERELTSDRTKKALAAKKARGEKLGGASLGWQVSYKLKTKEEKQNESMERGKMKRSRHQTSRDTQAFIRVLKRVFPNATLGDDPSKWLWNQICCKQPKRDEILSIMADYQNIDSTLFPNWDFKLSTEKNAQKLRSYMQAFKKSFIN